MTTNRLAKSSPPQFESRLTALDWHKLAVDKGHREAAAAWWRRAVELGEVNSDGRFRGAGE